MRSIARNISVAIVFIFIIPCLIHAFGSNEEKAKTLTIYSLKGPSGVGMVRLFEEPPQINGLNIKVEALANADLMAARFISGEAKIGILPANMAAKIASSGKDVRVVATIGTGMLTLLSSDPVVRSIKDLRGKSIEVAGQGATPYHLFRKILRSHGLDPDADVTLGYALAYPEIAQALIAGRVSNALLPEPFATMALMGKQDLKQISDIQEEWIRSGGTDNYPMTLLVVDGAFALANTASVKEIIDAVKASIEWVVAHPAEAGEAAEKHGLGFKAAVVAAAIPKSSYVFIPAADARSSLEELFKVFLENDPASIGNAMPGDRFYYNPITGW